MGAETRGMKLTPTKFTQAGKKQCFFNVDGIETHQVYTKTFNCIAWKTAYLSIFICNEMLSVF